MDTTAAHPALQSPSGDLDIDGFMLNTVLTALFKEALAAASDVDIDPSAACAADTLNGAMASALAAAATGFGQ